MLKRCQDSYAVITKLLDYMPRLDECVVQYLLPPRTYDCSIKHCTNLHCIRHTYTRSTYKLQCIIRPSIMLLGSEAMSGLALTALHTDVEPLRTTFIAPQREASDPE